MIDPAYSVVRAAKLRVRGEDLGQSGKDSMITEEKNADAYREMTDSSRDLLRVRHDARTIDRVKPDDKTHLLAGLDDEKEPTSFRTASAGY
jgi:hypothetical protein